MISVDIYLFLETTLISDHFVLGDNSTNFNSSILPINQFNKNLVSSFELANEINLSLNIIYTYLFSGFVFINNSLTFSNNYPFKLNYFSISNGIYSPTTL